MPEANEVRNYCDFIKKYLKGKTINSIKILNGRYKTHDAFEGYNLLKKMTPIKVLDVKTKGKLLYLSFENDIYMFNTLGLMGGWIGQLNKYKGSDKYLYSKNVETYSKNMSKDKISNYMTNSLNHLNVEFVTDNLSLYFYDTLSFGSIKVVKGIDTLNKKLKTIGFDIMDEETTFNIFKSQILKKKNLEKEIGIVLMDQKIISGIGNYLRADVLYMSKINPFRKVKSLKNNDLINIFDNCKILTWGEYDYKKAKKMGIITKNVKLPSDYKRMFFVYNQKKDIFGNEVSKEELYEGSQKRFIYWVKCVQK